MPIPDTNVHLTLNNLYPDRVKFAVELYLSQRISYRAFLALIDRPEIHRAGQNYRTLLRFPGPLGHATSARAIFRYPRARQWLVITMTWNALGYLHLMRSDYGDERALDRTINWLHPRQIRRNNRYIWEHVDEAIVAATHAAEQQFAAWFADVERRILCLCHDVSITAVEAAADLYHLDPGRWLSRLAGHFQRRFCHVIESRYSSSAAAYTQYSRRGMLLRGYSTRDIQIKAYVKTNRRARLECALQSRGLSRIAGRRSIYQSSHTFLSLFERCARYAVDQLNALLNDMRMRVFVPHGPVALIAAVVRRVRDPQLASDMLTHLIQYRRLHAGVWNRSTLTRLTSDRVLRRTARGLYALSHRYLHAREILNCIENRRWFHPSVIASGN